MKKILLASTALLASTGFAAADMVVGGDGYFGAALSTYNGDGFFETRQGDQSTYVFVYDLDIDFTWTGTSDSGLTYGGKIDLDDAASTTNTTTTVPVFDAQGNPTFDANGNLVTQKVVTSTPNNSQGPLGYEGEMFVSGDFGTLSMGDLDGANEQVNGDLAKVGLTGLGDFNEMIYLVDGNAQPSGSPLALYTYAVEGLKLALGITDDQGWSLGAGYAGDFWSVGIGYEEIANGATVTIRPSGSFIPRIDPVTNKPVLTGGTGPITLTTTDDAHQTMASGSITFSGVTVKGMYGLIDIDNTGDLAQYGLSAAYTWDALTLTAYWRGQEVNPDGASSYNNNFAGLGASYDLGGGLALKTGVVQADYDDLDSNIVIADFGLSFNF